jgi:acyl-coenzyme A synthetase/AMP-(fatty) acid ligase
VVVDGWSTRRGRPACRPTPASAYHKDPQRSTSTFFTIDGEQVAVPGDLGRIEADGSVTLIGRGTSVINTGGEKVGPIR